MELLSIVRKILIILHILFSTTRSSYKVAVVEYHREEHNGFALNTIYNMRNYIRIIQDISSDNKEVDLIVFPEGTLVFQSTRYTKEELLNHATVLPSDNLTIPCLDDNTSIVAFYIRELSCAASSSNVYLSINVIEKSTRDELFNANIVFDRQGRIISKYRKIHPLLTEAYISRGNIVESFNTDFGVSIGVFICFDIFFRDAFNNTLNNVDAFIFPSYWYSELPYLSSTQVQKMWSFLYGKVLFAAGGNERGSGTSGTGIYNGRNDSPTSYLSSSSETKVLISEIPLKMTNAQKKEQTHIRELDNFIFITKTPEMKIHPLPNSAANEEFEHTLCDNNFCCKVSLYVNDTSGLSMTIYNGLQPFIGFGNLGIQLCAVLQCEDNNCFKIPSNEYYQQHPKLFKKIKVEVLNLTKEYDYYPNVALQHLFFMSTQNFLFTDDSNTRKLELLEESTGIYTFGFYGRNYKSDDLPIRNNL